MGPDTVGQPTHSRGCNCSDERIERTEQPERRSADFKIFDQIDGKDGNGEDLERRGRHGENQNGEKHASTLEHQRTLPAAFLGQGFAVTVVRCGSFGVTIGR